MYKATARLFEKLDPMMRKLGNLFLQGLIAILPLAATIGVLFWLGSFAEALLGGILKLLLPDSWYVPGMGLLAGIIGVFLIGLLAQVYVFRHLYRLFENWIERIPLVKTIFNSIRDIAAFLASSKKKGDTEQTPVLVRLTDEIRVVGFITCASVNFIPDEELVSVYMPMSYQIGGYTVYLPKSRLEPLDMPVEDAMRLVLTAGMGTTLQNNNGHNSDTKQ
jgi:uncharacterized membrane protein